MNTTSDGRFGHRISRRNLVIAGAGLVGAGLVGWVRHLADSSEPTSPPSGSFRAGGSWGELIPLGRIAPVHVSMLPSGMVLVTGSRDREYTAQDVVNFAIDPRGSGSIEPRPMTVPLRTARDSLFCAGHTPLADGRLLYVGGQRKPPESGIDYAALFDGVAGVGAWQVIDADLIGGPAWYPTATRLPTGQVLTTSGFSDWGETPNRTMQLFDPRRLARNEKPWILLAPAESVPDVSPTGADYTHMFVLPRPVVVDGHVRHVAMVGKTGWVYLFNYKDAFGDPRRRFAARANGRRPAPGTSSMPAAGASSVLLADGRILVVGGGTEDGVGKRTLSSRAHIYDPERDRWRSIETGLARAHPVAVSLPDATVLVVNGDGGDLGDPRRPQIIDPDTRAVITGPPWPDPSLRGYHNVALLVPDGRVLTGGGEAEVRRRLAGPRERPDIRYYSPPYLSALAEEDRPKIFEAASRMGYAEPYRIRFRGGPVHRVTLVGLGSMTHSFDQSQRCVVLFDGEATGEDLTVAGPADGFAAPPGHYMLFILTRVRVGGDVLVPSVARVVSVE